MAKKISWLSAAEIIGVTPRTMRRWRERLEEHGCDGLRDRRRGKPSEKRVPLAVCEKVLELFQTCYYDCNVKHFHEKLREEHGIQLSYSWVKQALHGAGLVARKKKRTPHRQRRPRKELPGIMLHIDGSKHAWLQVDRYHDLIVMLDDATSDSPQARGRMERSYGNWQGRLPQELRVAGIGSVDQGQPVLAGTLHRGVQSQVHRAGGPAGHGVPQVRAARSGTGCSRCKPNAW